MNIKHLAQLSNLIISQDEAKKYPKQLSESLRYAGNLEDIDTSKVPDTFFTTNAINVMQEDEIDENVTLIQEEVLKNAQKTINGYFIVKRII